MLVEQKHILLVEDDPSLCQWISDYLSEHGYLVTIANRGDRAIELVRDDKPDLVLLDILLPHTNGFDVCREIRKFFSQPILIMTACGEESDEVLGLELGADDFLIKPIKLRVLLARINALLRRDSKHDTLKTLTFGHLSLNAKSKTILLNSTVVSMSVNEFELLWLLASRSGEVVQRDELISQFRGFEYDGFDRSVDIKISRLRKKLNDNPSKPYKIKTVRGQGYLFAEDAWND